MAFPTPSGVTLVAAPANGIAVTASYTAAPGFVAMAGPLAKVWDISTLLESTSRRPDQERRPLASNPRNFAHRQLYRQHTLNALNDTSKAWTQDQWRGYCVMITADPTTPHGSRQFSCITSNTATQMSVSLHTSPRLWGPYAIIDPLPMTGRTRHAGAYHPSPAMLVSDIV